MSRTLLKRLHNSPRTFIDMVEERPQASYEEQVVNIWKKGGLTREILSLESSKHDLGIICKAIAKERQIDFVTAIGVAFDEAPSMPKTASTTTKADFSLDTHEDQKKLVKAAKELARTEGIDFTEAVNRLLPDDEEEDL